MITPVPNTPEEAPMPEMLKRRRLALAGVACYLGAAVIFGGPAAAQKAEKPPLFGDEKPAAEEGGKMGRTRQYTGRNSCYGAGAGCHRNVEELVGFDGEPATARGIEGNIFEEYDPHGLAYTAINTDLRPRDKDSFKAARGR